MKARTPVILILPLVFFLFLICSTSSRAQSESDSQSVAPPDQNVTLQDFQDSLSDKGEWVKINPDEIAPDSVTDEEESSVLDADICTDYIWIPGPEIIYIGWSPYCDGYWGWTYWGWYWYPNYNWGWCTYHYGRWWHHHRYGWVWSPGYRWRHSWVTWCNSGNYIGWHPLPPRVHYRNGVAMMKVNSKASNDGWVFVEKKNLTKPVNRNNAIDINRHNNLIKDSRQYVDNRYTNSKTNGSRSVDWNSKMQYNSENTGRRTAVNPKQRDTWTKTPPYRGYENYPGKYRENTGNRNNNTHSNPSSRSGSWNKSSRSGNNNNGSRSNNSGNHSSSRSGHGRN